MESRKGYSSDCDGSRNPLVCLLSYLAHHRYMARWSESLTPVQNESPIMEPDIYFKRVRDLLNPDELAPKTVIIIGLGSGGSRVAVELTRAGLGRLVLVDLPGEKIEEHNVVRHELGYSALGQPKGAALAARLRDVRPNVSIESHELDVVRDISAFEAIVKKTGADLLLACTDGQDGRNAVNEVAVKCRLPAVFAGVYDNGVGGEVFTYRPDNACFACFAKTKNRNEPSPTSSKSLDYSNPDYKEFRSILALNLDILQISILHARQALDELLSPNSKIGSLPGNLIIFPNKRVDDIWPTPLRADFYNIKPWADCLVCSTKTLPDDWMQQLQAALNKQADSP